MDFVSKLIVKPEAPKILEQEFRKKSWKPEAIMFSGNTDCYQPAERKWRLTRQMLEVILKYRNPVGMISKNQLILRDLDILKELASMNLVHVMISITSSELGGDLGSIFTDWIHKAYPDKAEKVLNLIASCHGGQLNDSRFGDRMKGTGKEAESIRLLYSAAKKKYLSGRSFPDYDYSLFRRPPADGQMELFG